MSPAIQKQRIARIETASSLDAALEIARAMPYAQQSFAAISPVTWSTASQPATYTSAASVVGNSA